MNDGLLIRAFLPEDLARVAELECVCNPVPWTLESLRPFAESGDASAHRVGQVAVLDTGEITGYAGLQILGEEAEILIFGVAPEQRRKGIGRALLSDLKAAAKERGCRSVFLEVRTGNSAAVSLYRAEGFAAVGLRKRYYADNGEDALLMRWDPTG